MMSPISAISSFSPLPSEEDQKKPSPLRKCINKIHNVWKKFSSLIPDLFTREMLWRLSLLGRQARLPPPVVASASDGIGTIDALFSLVRSVNDAVATWIKESKFVHSLFCLSKVFSGVYFPISAYYTTKTCKKIVQGGPKEILFDRSMRLVTWLASLGESFFNPIIGLAEMGWIGESALLWAQPFYGVSVCLSLVSGAIHAKGGYEAHRFLREVRQQIGEPKEGTLADSVDVLLALENYRERLRGTLSRRRFRRVLQCKKPEMVTIERRIQSIQEALRQDPSDASLREKGRRVIQILDRQIQHSLASHSMAVVANLCMLIGVAILIFVPLGPVGSILVASGIVVGLASLITHKILDLGTEKQWKKLQLS